MAKSIRRERPEDCECGQRRCTCYDPIPVKKRDERSSAHKEYQGRDYADVVRCPICGPNCDGSCQDYLPEEF